MSQGLLRTLAVIALALGGLGLGATTNPASAASCSGTKIYSGTFKSSNTGLVVARLGVYRGGGNLCFIAVKDGVLYGEATYMDLDVNPPRREDVGNFLYSAGPITVPDTSCVTYHLMMKNRANQWIVDGPVQSPCF